MSINKVFVFNRTLPYPFDSLKSTKLPVSSKYGDGTESTISSTVCKAILAFCACQNGTRQGAVGIVDHRTVAEYKSTSGTDIYHLSVYDPTSGLILASIYDKNTELPEAYTVGTKEQDGTAVIFSMIPLLSEDEEFKENLDAFYDEFSSGYPDMTTTINSMATLCDNVYRRINDETCVAHLKLTIENSGNLMRVSQAHIDNGNFIPKAVVTGEFVIFAQTGPAPVLQMEEALPHTDFVGQYTLNEHRTLSLREQSLVPVLEPWYILPSEVVSICKHAKNSTGKSAQMRNFLLRGPAGTGKTEGARAIAAGLGLPYMIYTCSANTEVYDFVGMVFPETEFATTGDAILDTQRKELMEMGGITYENVAKLMQLPGLDDMDYDPEGVFKKITGVDNPSATSQECMGVVLDMVTDKVRELSRVQTDSQSSGQTYTYVETDFIKALKHGYVVEIQEPSTIMQPGVLVGLNSLLEQSGSITLPTGEVIKRHQDAVVIVTTNISYEGCRGMNQSVLDRMNLALDIELPSKEIMAQRVMSITGCEDDTQVSNMVQVVNDMADYCRKNGITDGAVGMRSLIDWVISTEITGDPYTSALYTVISKATSDEDDRNTLISSVLEPFFAMKRVNKAV